MALTTSRTLGSWIDEALNLLYRSTQRPAQVLLGPTALDAAGTVTQFTVTNPTAVQITAPSILECGQELMLVTSVSTDANPIYTVSRGYAGTPMAAAATGAVILINPEWGRYQTRRHILRGIRGTIQTQLPNLTNVTITPTVNTYYVPVPADCQYPVRLAYVQTDTNAIVKRFREISEWEFHDDLPTAISATGKAITVPPQLVSGNVTGVQTVQTLYLTYIQPYQWSGGTEEPAESETMNWQLQAVDLPPLYAAAYSLANREMTRLEIDRSEAWSQDVNFRQGSDLKLAQAAWQEFYRRLDEARREHPIPKHRTYRKLHRH